ncbi:Autoinducer 2 import ATP-binding protein LsrA [bioreactor metagenome]|uniref:Autoinducer 2 import ATP-binding protein LsrA n=1 Tax=bioreactor metagenome TaxID=1076179 RepID=A0A645FZR5_9ZZZZ
MAGVQGNGQAELVRCITGLMESTGGKVVLNNQDITKDSIKHRRQKGIAYIPEDRMEDGIAAPASLSDNIISTYYDRKDINSKLFMLNKKIINESERLIEKFSIKAKNAKQKVGSLSGGNIQKVVVAREYNTNPLCMIAEQPTHGIDIGSAEFIHTQLIDMRNKGAGILLISADLSEVMNLSDRLIVFYEGEIVGYFKDVKNISENELGLYMLGVKHQTKEEIGGALTD